MLKIIYIILFASLIIENESKCPYPIDTCDRKKLSFHLYKEFSKPSEEIILGDEKSIKNAKFIPKADFKILIHGYAGNKNKPPVMVALRDEYLKLKKFNVLVVDWGPLAVEGCYIDTAFPSVPAVGKCCADLVNAILKHKPGTKEDQFHVVAWSLGAQIAARFAVHFRPKVIARITGLDPAFPRYTPLITEPHNILNRNHAKFVDVLHSNMGFGGVYFSDAHYDIYINQGTFQNGCDWKDFNCCHRRCVEVFVESINPKTKFMAKKCKNNWYFVTFRRCNGKSKRRIEVGEYCRPPGDEKDTGTYHLRTNDCPPYARGPDA